MKRLLVLSVWLIVAATAYAQLQGFLDGFQHCLTAQDPDLRWLENWNRHCYTLYERTDSESFSFLSDFMRCTQAYFQMPPAKNISQDCLHEAWTSQARADNQTNVLSCFLINPINEICPEPHSPSHLNCLPTQPMRCRKYHLRRSWKLCTCAHRRITPF